MKITSLHVENFRAIQHVELTDLQDMVVIAGPNGCGKSCILDSIRLFKSVYGGYQPNEWQQWLGEFQINFQRNPQQMASLLRSRSRSSVISADVQLAADEIAFIRSRLSAMLEDLVWKTVVPGLSDPWLRARGALASELRAHKPLVEERVRSLLPAVGALLDEDVSFGRLEITPSGEAITADNVLLELVFSAFFPKHVGVIDYHGSHRNYGREELGGINLNLDREEDQFRNSALYNYANKYANIKSEMAAEYVRVALREKHGVALADNSESLSETLAELFRTFFPGKTFLGPTPTADGGLTFPVQVQGGETHDINDLSSGEKEVLFGYLRLRNSAPRHSVILLDEPELHLNPALVRGLPQFYRKNLGLALDNQIWLVTHSDAFLREAVGSSGLRVFHMQYAAGGGNIENQIHEIEHGEEFEAIILELVGDLAAYRPGAKVVFFEGENSEFDQKMVARLFPEVEKAVNFVSGGSKDRVERLHRTLERSVEAGRIPIKIYSVVDRDLAISSGMSMRDGTAEGFHRHYDWGVYHIENFLLDASFVWEALKQLNIYRDELASPELVETELKEIAKRQISSLVVHEVGGEIRAEMIEQLNLRGGTSVEEPGDLIHRNVVGAVTN
ncbi:MAG: AAA family ATPase, partial [Gammaproteobacteria bacterium]|nr:AAA family ATPase [Gammaproteobacteria bacterium]